MSTLKSRIRNKLPGGQNWPRKINVLAGLNVVVGNVVKSTFYA